MSTKAATFEEPSQVQKLSNTLTGTRPTVTRGFFAGRPNMDLLMSDPGKLSSWSSQTPSRRPVCLEYPRLTQDQQRPMPARSGHSQHAASGVSQRR